MKKNLFVFLAAILLLSGIEKSYAQENITPIRTDVAGFTTWTDTDIPGITYLQLLKATATTVTPAMNFDNYTGETLNFEARTYGGVIVAENTITVSISTNNGTDWTVLGTRVPASSTMTPMAEFDLSAYNGTEVKIKFSVEGTDDLKGAGIDNISITGFAPATAMLIVNPTSLSGFNYIVGSGPSTEQSFTLSGTTLDLTNVTITASANYKISLTSGGAFDSETIILSTYDGSDTQVFVRLIAGLTVADYNTQNITISGGGASDVTVTCNGSVSDIPSPTLIVNPTSLSGLDYLFASGPSAEQSFTLSGLALDGSAAVITPSTNLEISLTSGGIFLPSAITISSFTGSDTQVFVRLKSGLDVANYNSEMITVTGGGASNVEVPCIGSVIDGSSLPCLAENFSGFAAGSHASASPSDISASLDTYTATTGWIGYKVYQAGGEVKLGTGSLNGYMITPTVDLSAGGSVSFDYSKYSTDASVVQVFHASDGVTFVQIGTDITPTTDFQSFSIDITDGTALSKIKIGTNINRAFLDNIAVYCGGIVPTPTLNVDPTILNGFNYVVGSGPSAEQLFTLSGTILDNSNVIIYPPTDYEISLSSGTGFQPTEITIPSFDGSNTQIYVRLIAGRAISDYNSEEITISGGGASIVTVTCNGSVSDIPGATLTADPTSLTGLNYIFGSGPSAEQSFTLSGTDLNGGNVTITPLQYFEISLTSGLGFDINPITLLTFTGASTTVYVRLKADLSIGEYNAEAITISGGGATDISVTCSGIVEAFVSPILTANPTDLSGFNYLFGSGRSNEQWFTLSGDGLNGSNVTITPSLNYELSLTSGTYLLNETITLTAFDGTATQIFVRLKAGLDIADYNFENITISGGGAADAFVTCNGSVTDGSAFPCLEEDFSGFTTGTHAAPSTNDLGAEMDTYTMATGWSGLKIFSAGGEIKLGTGSISGYIITPTLDLSQGASLNFDYAQWATDASVIQIFHASDGVTFVQVGPDITPATDFQSYSFQIAAI
jgi:hypothetical protein